MLLVILSGTVHFEQVGECLVHGVQVLLDDFVALLAVGIANRLRMASIACSRGSTLEMAKKQSAGWCSYAIPCRVSRATCRRQ